MNKAKLVPWVTYFFMTIFVCISILLAGCTGDTTTSTTSTLPSTTTATTTTATTPAVTSPSTTTTTTTTSTVSAPVVTQTASPDISSLTLLSVLKGSVSLKEESSDQWTPIERGVTLKPGDTIRAGNDSTAEILFFDGSVIELDPDTVITVAELGLSEAGSTTIHLRQDIGRTVSRVQKLADSASSYQIETRAAVAAVRGSTMIVVVEPDGTTVVTNVHGDIRVIAQGMETIIPENMQSTVQVGQVPGTPETIVTPTTTTPPPVVPVYSAVINTNLQADRTTASVGDVIQYTFTIANAGNLAITSVTVTGSLTGTPAYAAGDANSNSCLDPGETWTYTDAHTVTGADPSPLVNTATFTVITANGQQLVAQDQVQVVITGVTVEITSPADGSTITTHTITVAGTVSDVSITQATIDINGISHMIAVNAGAFLTEENVNNGEVTVTVTVTYGDEETASDSITLNVEIESFDLRIELTWDTNETDLDAHLLQPGGTLEDIQSDCFYNNENPDWGVAEVSTDDPSLDQDDMDGYGPENITLQTAADAGVYEYKVHYFGGVDPTNATVRIWFNEVLMAQFSLEMEEDDVWDVAYILNEEGSLSIVVPGIAVTKTADVEMAHVEDTITYTYNVSNSGNVSLSNITVTDDLLGVIENMTGGDDNENGQIDPGETWVYSDTYLVNSEDPSPLVNTVDVTGDYEIGKTVTASDSASVAILKPGISISMAADKTEAAAGEEITYTCTVTNAGNTALSAISVMMSLDVAVDYQSGDTNANGLLDVGETWIYTATYTVHVEDPSPLNNTATASGSDALEETVTDDDTVSVTIPQ